jgi:uncharacterized membrane protein SirB2
MIEYYLQIKLAHIACVALSGALFAFRGMLRLADLRLANHIALRFASYAIDTTLLTLALMLMGIIHQYPFVNAWLTAKILLLVLYIGLGIFALRRGTSRARSACLLAAALAVFAAIIGVAVAHDVRGWAAFLT